MNCPVCSKEMTTSDFGGVHVDVCRDGCKGLWFDWAELARLDEHHEGAGRALQEALHYPRTNDAGRARLNCPKCGLPMFAHQYEAIQQVNIDECYDCRAIFVDSGELKEIRDHLISREEEEAYLQKLLHENPAVQAGKSQLTVLMAQRDEALRHWTRFLRLSYWMTGR